MSAYTAVESQGLRSAANRRGSPRTFLMLAATMRHGGTFLQVRIRNVSEIGALIEGEGLPEPGEIIHLSRGETEIDGVIAWASGVRRGVHFSRPVPVDTWRAGKPVPPKGGQERVDRIQAAARAGGGAERLPQPAEPERWIGQLDERVGEEIAFVQRLIEALGDELVADPEMLQRHAPALQNIDLSSQILGHLARVMAAAERAEAVRAIGMEDLRARLTRDRGEES
jgi:hypothetical protein